MHSGLVRVRPEYFITIDEITAKTSITQSDVLFTLYESGICVYQGQVCIRLTEAMLDTSLNSLSRKRRINIENLKAIYSSW